MPDFGNVKLVGVSLFGTYIYIYQPKLFKIKNYKNYYKTVFILMIFQ